MFSKSLFKQSCKANGAMWAIITFATCFMLACVMLIAGGGNLSGTKTVIMDSIIEGELTASTQNRSIHYYLISDAALAHFDGAFKEEAAAAAPKEEEIASYIAAYTKAKTEGKTDEEAIAVADAAVGKPSAKAYALAKIAARRTKKPPPPPPNPLPRRRMPPRPPICRSMPPRSPPTKDWRRIPPRLWKSRGLSFMCSIP